MFSLSDEFVSIVVVGAGIIGSKHASFIVRSGNAILVGIIDPTSAGAQLASKHSCAYFRDVSEMLSVGFKPDAAIVCTPNETHVPISMELASAGIHLLIEKPVSTSVKSGKTLLKFCREKGVRVCVGHHRRLHSSVSVAKLALQSGTIGNVIGVSGLWAALKPDSYFEGNGQWRAGPGGGVVYINLIHEIDLLQCLVGRVTRVSAEQAVSTRGNPAVEGVAVTLRFDTGAVGTFLALDSSPSPFTIEQGTGENPAFPFSGKDSYRLFGPKGAMSIPDNSFWRPTETEKGWYSELGEVSLDYTPVDPYERQLENFVNVVKNLEWPSCSGEDGLAAVAVCEAVIMSLQDGQPVEVETVST